LLFADVSELDQVGAKTPVELQLSTERGLELSVTDQSFADQLLA
jgi:hypothetical protein